MRVLVSGASGFVGGALVRRLLRDGQMEPVAAVRCEDRSVHGARRVVVGDLGFDTDWSSALQGCEMVVHAAARVHVMRDRVADSLAEYRRINVAGTAKFAEQAASSGVRRFVLLSSVKVLGERTEPGRPYRASDVPAPLDAYGISKLEAETSLYQIAKQTGMEVVVIRPVLVYGPGVRANFRIMLRAVQRGLPIPLDAVANRRSIVALDNLVDLVIHSLSHPAAPEKIFLVSDDEDLSTPELLRRIGYALGRPPRLFGVPVPLLRALAAVGGRLDMVRRLTESLQVDIGATRTLLGWSPPKTVDEALRDTVRAFVTENA